MATEDKFVDADVVALTAEIVAAYVSNNHVAVSALSDLIQSVHESLQKAASVPEEPVVEPLVPAVPVKKSITPDYIICLEDGKQFKSLKRHLGTHYNMTPDEYRRKWGLPTDYPMVAPNYAAARSALAKSSGLGRKAAPVPEVPAPAPAKRRAPRKKTADAA